MKSKLSKLCVSILVISLLLTGCGTGRTLEPPPTPTTAPEIGLPFHEDSYYELVYIDAPVTWKQAVELANSRQVDACQSAHLATITSAEEQAIVTSLMQPLAENAWLGGFQPEDELASAQNWQWVTGESFSYTNWSPDGEPNDTPAEIFIAGSEQYMETYQGSGVWNDVPNSDTRRYFIVEYENCQ